MAGGGASNKSSNGGGPTRVRKRVEIESASANANAATTNANLKRAKDGSAFARCKECNKDVPIALINFHNCSLDAKIKMNLEAQVVENQTETKKPAAKYLFFVFSSLTVDCILGIVLTYYVMLFRSKEKSTEPKAKREKKPKNPNAPKRPPTAFFVFMDEFRQTFKAANPDCKSVSTVAKEGGEKWKSMTDEEKKPYQDKAAELKAAYEKALKSNNDADNANDDGDEPEKEVKEDVEADAE
ncbi:High mobility group B protein 7 [Capsicum annuum]|nr:High mobility group B protein 7 [Capsicum annuum]